MQFRPWSLGGSRNRLEHYTDFLDLLVSVVVVISALFLQTLQNRSVRQFLLTNLVEQNGHYAWRVNLEAISAHLEHIMSFPSFDAMYDGPTLFLGGASSAYIR